MSNKDSWTVYTGDFRQSTTDSKEQDHKIKMYVIHKDYDRWTLDNDIGMIILIELFFNLLSQEKGLKYVLSPGDKKSHKIFVWL